jgi:hypothetical protein
VGRLVLLSLAIPLTGCGAYFVGFTFNPYGTQSVSGTVSAAGLGFVHDPSGTTEFTSVTFVNPGSAVTVNFCGDQRNLFPLNQKVQADFTTGTRCATLIRVVSAP